MTTLTTAKSVSATAMDEKQAGGLWCPHVRYPVEMKGVWIAVNRIPGDSNPEWARCIRAQCIYWERTYDREQKTYVGKCVAKI
jgi:hypothetical protein